MSNLSRIDKILFEIQKELGLNQAQLADSLGVKPQAITKWKSRNKIPKSSKISLITQFGVSENFLNTGSGPFYSTDTKPYEKPIIDHKALENNDVENKIVKNTVKPNILHIPAAAEAGFMGGGIEAVTLEDTEPWYMPGIKGQCYSFIIKGDSMMDTLRAGEMVITSSSMVTSILSIINDYIYVIETNDGFIVKRVAKHSEEDMIWVLSDNEDYKDYEIHFSEIRRMFKARRIVSFNLSHKMRYE